MRIGTLWRLCVAAGLASCARGSTGEVIDADTGSGSGQPDANLPPGDAGCNGLPCNAIYVAPTGADTNVGVQTAPMRTISAAIKRATMSTPALPIYVQAGKYTEKIAMASGVEIHGGYDTSWARVMTAISEIDGPIPAITFDQINAPTVLDTFTVKAADAMGAGASSMAIVITSSTMVTLQAVTVIPGIGAAGVDGNNGTTGTGAGDGGPGQPGTETSTSLFCSGASPPSRGTPGSSACGRPGGGGGAAGQSSGNGATGDDGTVNVQSGGFGGLSSKDNPNGICINGVRTSGDGQAGADGPPGTPGGVGGAGLSQGTFTKAVYVPANGGNGTSGTAGQGGGGGGGGGGGTSNCTSSGSTGGGGGGGGCGGTGGTGGSGGGGSFGIVVVDSSVVISSSTIMANHGGAGGKGGGGGGGGSGGNGGSGGAYGGTNDQDDGGCGDHGGHGGAGGAGGSGGGGGGGPSAAVVCVGSTSVSIPSSALTGGIGGSGGASAGNSGAAGVSTKSIGCSFF